MMHPPNSPATQRAISQSPVSHERWQSRNAEAGAKLNRRCALVVDDEEDSREALAILLRWVGYDVHLAADGEAALDTAARYLPEVIFLDIGMPGMSGYEVCGEMRRSPLLRDARIFALSGFTGETHDTRCSEAGFTAQITKPINPTLLEDLA
jgi:CheY-like chemotaxis protein